MNVNISLLKLNSLQKLLRENQPEYIIANDSLNGLKVTRII